MAGEALCGYAVATVVDGNGHLEQISVAVGSGQMTPQDAASNYDKDVEKQAKQLGLPGW